MGYETECRSLAGTYGYRAGKFSRIVGLDFGFRSLDEIDQVVRTAFECDSLFRQDNTPSFRSMSFWPNSSSSAASCVESAGCET